MTTLRSRALRAAISSAILLIAPVAFAVHEQSYFGPVATRLVERWARENTVLTDPALPDAMAASLYNFEVNFCFSGNGDEVRKPCEQLVVSDSALYVPTKKYLDALLLSGATTVETYFELLAQAIGSEGARTGWPPTTTNPYRCVMFDSAITVGVANDRGTYQPAHPVRRVCMRTGTHSLIALTQGKRSTATLTLKSNAAQSVLSAWSEVSSSSVPAEGTCDRTSFALPYKFLCVERTYQVRVGGKIDYGPGRDRVIQTPSSFSRAVGLRIAIDDVNGRCATSTCRSALDRALLDSIALWRGACGRCDSTSLAVVDINGRLFVDERLVAALSGSPNVGTEYFSLRGHPLVRFVSLNAAARAALGSPSGEWTRIARFNRREESAPSIRVRLGGPSAACGGDSSLIACAGADSDVELNTRDFRFSDERQVVLGAGENTVDLSQVLIHEVGHWFGVPHVDPVALDGRRAMMEEIYGLNGQCVTGGELNLLDQSADLKWENRLSKCSGLHYPVLRKGVR